uniref:H15 domain-containing protein n=1 Tax=Syphacia muris TaxID=451379 RepID=A0A0N5ARJ8_9BILA
MSSETPATAATETPKKASPKKVAGGVAKAKKAVKPAAHPSYGEMIKDAIIHLKEKKGSSRAAILKFISQNYKVSENLAVVNAHLRQALKRGVTSNALKQVRGNGASGSFRLAQIKPVEKKVKKVPKPKAKKPTSKKVAAKKPVAKSKTAAKKKVQKKPAKTPAAKPKAASKKTPAKAKKPAAAAKTKPAAKKTTKPTATKKTTTAKSKKA